MQIPFTVNVPEDVSKTQFDCEVIIDVNDNTTQRQVLDYANSSGFRSDFGAFVAEKFPAFGFSRKNGFEPIFKESGNRNTPVVAYRQIFTLVKNI